MAAVEEEEPQNTAQSQDLAQEIPQTEPQMYEKLIDEMEVDEHNQDDVNEDELLAEPMDDGNTINSNSQNQVEQNLPSSAAEAQTTEEKTEEKPATDEENRGTKRRSDSPSKTPRKNVNDFHHRISKTLSTMKTNLNWTNLPCNFLGVSS